MKKNAMLTSWCDTPEGKRIYLREKAIVDHMLMQCLGYYFVHLGAWPTPSHYDSTHIKTQLLLSTQLEQTKLFQVTSSLADLALKDDSVDAVYCPHVLEFIKKPQHLLREIERILVPEGHIIVSCFSPLSLWQLTRWLRGRRRSLPLSQWLTYTRVHDWLQLLGFDILRSEYMCFYPPSKHETLQLCLDYCDPVLRNWWHFGAGIFIMLARKKTMVLTPIKYKWRLRQKILTAGLPESSIRSQ